MSSARDVNQQISINITRANFQRFAFSLIVIVLHFPIIKLCLTIIRHMNKEIQVNEANQRFDRFLRKYFKAEAEVTLADIYSRIRK